MTAPPATAYCLLGSNLGDRAARLRQAAHALADAERIELLRAGGLFETAPWGRTDQPAYLNAAVEIRTTLPPEALLDLLQQIERRIGRTPARERWTPRVIDVDLALYADRIVETPRLAVPHPRITQRAFAMQILLDLDPALADPVSKKPYAQILRQLLQAGPAPDPVWQGPLVLDAADPEAPLPGPGDCLLYRSAAPGDTERLAEAFGQRFQGGEVVALAGPLGAGKTCFTSGLARGLGIRVPVTSPSYVLVKSYEGRLHLHHADFYRLEGAGPGPGAPPDADPPDAATLGLEDYLDDPGAVVLVEWADRCPAWLEPPFWFLQLTGAGDAPRFLLLRRIV